MNKEWIYMKKLFLLVAVIVALITIIGIIGCRATPEDLMEAMNIPIENADFYTPKSYDEYEKSLLHAQEVLDDENSSKFTLYIATQDLKNSIDDLQKRADKTNLIEIVSSAKSIDVSPYIPNSQSALLDAISQAEKVLTDENAVDDDVQEVQTRIDAAIEGLIPIPDKNELCEKYSAAQEFEEDKYISQTFITLKEALLNAESVIDDENAVEESVTAAIQALSDAIDGLEERPDKTELLQYINIASNYDVEKYTTASYKELQDAIMGANATVDDTNANKHSVDSAIEELMKAIEGLTTYSTCIWKISTSLYCADANHVGSDWSSTISYNNETVSGTFEVTDKEGTVLSFSAEVVENDNSPDIGAGSLQITLSDGNTVGQEIYVTENRGQYAGYQATWVFTVKCELVEKI